MLGHDSGEKIQNTCLLIACHKSTLTKVSSVAAAWQSGVAKYW